MFGRNKHLRFSGGGRGGVDRAILRNEAILHGERGYSDCFRRFRSWRNLCNDRRRKLRNEATVLLKLAQGGQGFVEAALGGGHSALNDGKSGEALMQFFDRAGPHRAGLEHPHAAETPVMFGELVDQDVFGGTGGLVFAAEVVAEGIEFGGVFTGQNELFGVEPVLEGIAAGSRFAFGGPGTGRELGILPVDFGADRRSYGSLRGLSFGLKCFLSFCIAHNGQHSPCALPGFAFFVAALLAGGHECRFSS